MSSMTSDSAITSSSSSMSVSSANSSTTTAGLLDITNQIFTNRSGSCAAYVNSYEASVQDIQRMLGFDASLMITSNNETCTLVTNAIPNHDFNDESALFANTVAVNVRTFVISANPVLAANTTPLAQSSYNGIMLNGVVVDLLSAGCYRPGPGADPAGNVQIGCNVNTDSWILDPLSPLATFNPDSHNAHTQPDGTYHYHGNPNAMFDDNPGPLGSPVIGFASDGFPIYGSYFMDPDSGTVRKALSGYTLKVGARPSSISDPGGEYNGLYIDDYEFTNAGDLDACNGMTVDGQYGYYVTDSYPWVLNCLSGTPNASFNKGAPR
jgi:hypothetical protein